MPQYIWLFLFLMFSSFVKGQKDFTNQLSELSFHSDIMLNTSKEEHRMRGLHEFLPLLKDFLATEGSFEIPLDDVESIMILKHQDFRIISFPFVRKNQKTENYAFIQRADGTYFELIPETNLSDIEYETLGTDRWVDALYYHMIPFGTGIDTSYLLFGFTQTNSYNKRKILDVLTWEEGKPSFGKQVFVFPQEGARDVVKNRLIYNYSADVYMALEYDELKKTLLLDHLISRKGRLEGQGMTQVPDGTYEAFNLIDGRWMFKSKMFDNNEKATPETPEDEGIKRDVFGKVINKN